MGYLFVGFVAICSIVVWIIYHSIFDVCYFGSGGCLKEVFACIIAGAFLAGVIIKYWYIAIIILIIIGVIFALKNS